MQTQTCSALGARRDDAVHDARQRNLAVVSGLRREARNGRVGGRRARLRTLGLAWQEAKARQLATVAVALATAFVVGCSLDTRPIHGRELERDAGDVAELGSGDGHSVQLEHLLDSGRHRDSSIGSAGQGGRRSDSGPLLPDETAVSDDAGAELERDAGDEQLGPDASRDAGAELEHDAGVPPPATHQCTARCVGGLYHCPNAAGSFSCVNSPCTCSGASPPDSGPPCTNGAFACPRGADSFYCSTSVCGP